MRVRRRCILLLAVLQVFSVARAQDDGQEQTKRIQTLLERIAKGDEVESAAASRQLAETVVAPVADAIGALEQRPPAEQLRIRGAVSRLSAALRYRLMRAGLPEPDRALLDEFARRYEDIGLQLFDDDLDVRVAALNQVPLAANTGAGVLIAAKITDEADEVAIDAAFEAAVKLRDPVVARRLRRYVSDITSWIRGGHLAAIGRDSLDMLVGYAVKSIEVIGAARDVESVPAILEHVGYFAETSHWKGDVQGIAALSGVYPPIAHVATALGEIGDARATPALLRFLDDPRFMRTGQVAGRKINQTVGDTVMLALARINKIPFEELGLLVADDPPNLAGFAEERARAEAQQKLKARLGAGGASSGRERPNRPAASQPSGGG